MLNFLLKKLLLNFTFYINLLIIIKCITIWGSCLLRRRDCKKKTKMESKATMTTTN